MKKIIQFLLALVFVYENTNAQIITTIAGTGTGTYFADNGNDGPATAAVLGAVYAVAINDSGNIFVSSKNNTVRKINSAGIIMAFAGNDTAGYSGDGGPARAGIADAQRYHAAAAAIQRSALQPGGDTQWLDAALADEQWRQGVSSGRRTGGARNGAGLQGPLVGLQRPVAWPDH